MNISTRSWHYKAAQFASGIGRSVPNNLCPYMRRVLLGALVFMTMLVVAIAVTAAIVGVAIVSMVHLIDVVFYDFSWFDPLQWTGPNSGRAALVLMGYCLNAFVIGGLVWAKTEDRRKAWVNARRTKMNEPQVPTELSLLGQWLKDRHDKVCRHLTFNHDTDEVTS